MAPFKYFVPVAEAKLVADGRLSASILDEYGLARALSDVERVGRDVTVASVTGQGPGGSSGVILTPHVVGDDSPPTVTGYRPAKQHWYPLATGAQIGWELDAPPKPAELRRRQIVAGHEVLDGEGNKWLVPVARSPHEPYGLLPQAYGFDEAGEPVGRLKPEYRELWERAAQIWEVYAWIHGQQAKHEGLDVVLRDKPPEEWFHQRWMLTQAVWILGVNYRVGPAEFNALLDAERMLLDDDFKHAVCQAVCDFDFLAELLQKKTGPSSATPPSGSSSTPGDEGATPATGRASPAC